MVFIPILTMQLEVGQLFRDIAVAISVAVMLSLVVAMTVIPALSKRLLTKVRPSGEGLKLPLIDRLAGGFSSVVMAFTRSVVRSRAFAFGVAAFVTVGALASAYALLPKLEYLPDGNRNLVFGVIIPPPGYNLATKTEIAKRVEAASQPLWVNDDEETDPDGPARIKNFFFVSARGFIFLGAQAEDPQRAGELIDPLSEPVFAEPGTFGFITQPSMFGRGIGGGRTVDLDISGPDLTEVLGVALQAAGLVSGVPPREQGHQLRPKPGLELGAPEVRLIPDRIRLADAGVSARTLATTVDAFNDGLRVAEITVGGSRLDLTLLGPKPDGERTQSIASLPVVTSSGQILPASSLARIEVTEGPNEILHLERERTVTLEIRPANDLALESALEILEQDVVGALREGGLPPGVKVNLAGTADQLTQTWGRHGPQPRSRRDHRLSGDGRVV